MRIGFIGAGAVATSIARSALTAGHEVILSARRGPNALSGVIATLGKGASAADIVEAASQEIVFLAVPWRQIDSALAGLPPWKGRLLVDTTNPFIETQPKLVLADLDGLGASEVVARLAPDAQIVKAFNSIRMVHYDAGPRHAAGRRVLFVSGDDQAAKVQIANLIESFGFATIDLGGLAEGGRLQQAGGPLAGLDLILGD